jgi:3-oxoacyl-[acyl-carrier protein] reductase
MSNDSRVALVTGAASGIGLSVAQELARNGFRLVVVDRANDVDHVARTLPGECMSIQCDLTDTAAVFTLHERVMASVGRCDVLVNNAGVHPKIEGVKEDLQRLTLESWNQVVAINLTAPFLLSKLFLPSMIGQRWGRIINVSSRGGRTLIPNCGAHYAATKAGVVGLTRILAEEGAAANVTANTVAPGRITTPLSNITTTQILDRAIRAIPLGRVGTPDELAAAVAFLASEQASYITGAVLDVNGGSFMP